MMENSKLRGGRKCDRGCQQRRGDDDSRLIIKMLYLQSGRKCDRGAKTGGVVMGVVMSAPLLGYGGVN